MCAYYLPDAARRARVCRDRRVRVMLALERLRTSRRIVLHGGQDMGVHVHREGAGGVAEHAHHL
jgi:hypothetical protein